MNPDPSCTVAGWVPMTPTEPDDDDPELLSVPLVLLLSPPPKLGSDSGIPLLMPEGLSAPPAVAGCRRARRATSRKMMLKAGRYTISNGSWLGSPELFPTIASAASCCVLSIFEPSALSGLLRDANPHGYGHLSWFGASASPSSKFLLRPQRYPRSSFQKSRLTRYLSTHVAAGDCRVRAREVPRNPIPAPRAIQVSSKPVPGLAPLSSIYFDRPLSRPRETRRGPSLAPPLPRPLLSCVVKFKCKPRCNGTIRVHQASPGPSRSCATRSMFRGESRARSRPDAFGTAVLLCCEPGVTWGAVYTHKARDGFSKKSETFHPATKRNCPVRSRCNCDAARGCSNTVKYPGPWHFVTLETFLC